MNPLLRNLPNALTVFRVVAAPAMALLLVLPDYVAALAVFAAAGLSDAADGWLAKRFRLESRVGAWLDPAADKLLMLAVIVTLTVTKVLPLWFAAVVIGRDVLIVLGILLARWRNWPLEVAPLPVGKITTLVQLAYIGVYLLGLAFGVALAPYEPWAGYAVAALTIYSGIAYGRLFFAAMRAGAPAPGIAK